MPLAPAAEQSTEKRTGQSTVSIDLSLLGPLERERAVLLIRGLGARFVSEEHSLWIGGDQADSAQNIVDEIVAYREAATLERRCRPAGASRAREDRRRRTAYPAPRDKYESKYFAGLTPRTVAHILDGFIIGLPAAIAYLYVGSAALIGFAALALAVGCEWAFGRTPGKFVVGVQVEMLGGGALTARAAVLRNSWILLGFFPFGNYLSLPVQAAIAIQIGWEATHRGPHDYLAGTVVVRTRQRTGHQVQQAQAMRTDAKPRNPEFPL